MAVDVTPLHPRSASDPTDQRSLAPFPVSYRDDAAPQVGEWHPMYGLVAHSDHDLFICTACGDLIGTYPAGTRLEQLHWMVSHGHQVGAVIPVDDEGRCPDCVWMEIPATADLRHIRHAVDALQLSLEVERDDAEDLFAALDDHADRMRQRDHEPTRGVTRKVA